MIPLKRYPSIFKNAYNYCVGGWIRGGIFLWNNSHTFKYYTYFGNGRQNRTLPFSPPARFWGWWRMPNVLFAKTNKYRKDWIIHATTLYPSAVVLRLREYMWIKDMVCPCLALFTPIKCVCLLLALVSPSPCLCSHIQQGPFAMEDCHKIWIHVLFLF